MSTIFISHSSKDNAAAEDLRRKLEQDAKHTCVFLDFDPTQGIEAGRSWERTLYRKLRACRVVIAICTDNYLRSEWCFAEVALARMEGKTVITLFSDGYTGAVQLPSILEEKQYIDLRTQKSEGYQRLWHRLDRLDVLGLAGDWDPNECPYPGLAPYQERHAAVFFGREEEVRVGMTLLDRGAPGLIMVLGASGSGKSSFMRAGVLPRLRNNTDRWILVEPFRPGRDPFSALAQALAKGLRADADAPLDDEALRAALEAWEPPEPRAPELTIFGAETAPPDAQADAPLSETDSRLLRLVAELEALRSQTPGTEDPELRSFLDWSVEDLRRICGVGGRAGAKAPPDTPLIEAALRLRQATARLDARVLLVIDQFEELLADQDASAQTMRFLRLVQASLDAPDTPLMVFTTMRSDFFDAFQRLNAGLQLDFETMSLGPMSTAGIQKAIEAPARLGAVTLETGLTSQILEEAASPDALPLVAYMLWLLWHKCHDQGELTVEAYQSLGGVVGALSAEAQAALDRAQHLGKAAELRGAFLQMVRLGEDGQYTRQPARWDSDALRPVHDQLETLRDRRLLIPHTENGVEMVEVAHEALFRHWAPLRQWIDEERATFLLRQQLATAAATWAESGRHADDLWRGARLAQAVDLWREGGLAADDARSKTSRAFVKAGETQRKWQVRRRTALIAGVVAVLSAFLGYALREEHEAKSLQRASWAREQAMLSGGLRDTDPARSVALAQRAVCVTQSFDGYVLPDAQLALNHAVHALQRQQVLTKHRSPVTQVRFLPAGESGGPGQRMVSVGQGREAFLWTIPEGDAGSGCEGAAIGQLLGDSIRLFGAGEFQPLLVTAGDEAGLLIYDAARETALPKPSVVMPSVSPATVLALSAQADRLAFGDAEGTVIIAPSSGTIAGVSLAAHTDAIAALAFSEDGSRLASAARDGSLLVSDAVSGSTLVSLDGHREAIVDVVFGEDLLISGDWAGHVIIWDLTTGAPRLRLSHAAAISALVLLPATDGPPVLASASWDGTVRLWSTVTGEVLSTLQLGASVAALAVATAAPQSEADAQQLQLRLAAGTWDGRVHLWDLAGETLAAGGRQVIAQHGAPVNDLSFSADGALLASASDDKHIVLSRLTSKRTGYAWRTGIDVSPGSEGQSWIAITKGSEVELRYTGSGAQNQSIVGYKGTARRIAFSTDGTEKLGILADELFEYHLDPSRLMQCADSMIGLQPEPATQPPSLTDRCDQIPFSKDFRSILSRIRSGGGDLVRRVQNVVLGGAPE